MVFKRFMVGLFAIVLVILFVRYGRGVTAQGTPPPVERYWYWLIGCGVLGLILSLFQRGAHDNRRGANTGQLHSAPTSRERGDSRRPAMTKEELEAKVAEFKNVPRQVKAAARWSLALGAAVVLRFLAYGQSGRMTRGGVAILSAIVLLFFWAEGLALYRRSKQGFVLLLVLAILPLLGVFGLAIHSLRLTLEGSSTTSSYGVLHWASCVVQLVATPVFLCYLLSKTVRTQVWGPQPEGTNATRQAGGLDRREMQ
jgi:hypothetical protein